MNLLIILGIVGVYTALLVFVLAVLYYRSNDLDGLFESEEKEPEETKNEKGADK